MNRSRLNHQRFQPLFRIVVMKDRTPPLSAQRNQLTTNEQPIPDSKLASYLNQDLEWWFEAKPGANCIQKSTKFLLNAFQKNTWKKTWRVSLDGRYFEPYSVVFSRQIAAQNHENAITAERQAKQMQIDASRQQAAQYQRQVAKRVKATTVKTWQKPVHGAPGFSMNQADRALILEDHERQKMESEAKAELSLNIMKITVASIAGICILSLAVGGAVLGLRSFRASTDAAIEEISRNSGVTGRSTRREAYDKLNDLFGKINEVGMTKNDFEDQLGDAVGVVEKSEDNELITIKEKMKVLGEIVFGKPQSDFTLPLAFTKPVDKANVRKEISSKALPALPRALLDEYFNQTEIEDGGNSVVMVPDDSILPGCTVTFSIENISDVVDISITNRGTEDTPFFEVVAKESGTLKNIKLLPQGVSGTLHLSGLDEDSTYRSSVSEILENERKNTRFSEYDLIDAIELDNSSLNRPTMRGSITWTFNADKEAFKVIPPGETTILNFRIRAENTRSYVKRVAVGWSAIQEQLRKDVEDRLKDYRDSDKM